MNYRLFIFLFLFLVVPFQSISSDYQKITTRYFDFFFNQYDKNVIKHLANESDMIAETVMSNLGVVFRGRIKVQIVKEHEFQRVQPHHANIPDWASGVAYHKLLLIIIKSPREVRGMRYNLKKTFTHELTHVLLGSGFKGDERIPRWLNEGIAMYESREWSFARVSAITHAVLTNSLLPLSEITHSFPDERREAELAYCQSFYLISFFFFFYGRERFHDFIRYYSKEKMLEDTLLKVYGMNLRQLENKWHSYLKMRFNWIPIITSASTLWFIITLIFIVGYIRKKHKANVTLQQWEKEEVL